MSDDLDRLAKRIPDGALIALPPEYSFVPMAVIRALVVRRTKNLRLLVVPVGGMGVDILIGAGCVDSVEAAAVSLGEVGPAPCFVRAVKNGDIRMRDSTCPAIHTALQAAEKGVPFMPLGGLVGSDLVAVFIAIPFVLHQAWAFVAPGLYDNEKMLAIPILVSSVALFYAGAAFAYYVVFPLLFEFFTQTGPENVAVMTDINQYLNFVLKLFFAFGVAFEIPIATFLLILSGATTVESLSKKRPYIVLGCFVVGMLLTPPDVISQSLLAIPMYLLYEVGLLFGRLVRKRRAEADAEDQES